VCTDPSKRALCTSKTQCDQIAIAWSPDGVTWAANATALLRVQTDGRHPCGQIRTPLGLVAEPGRLCAGCYSVLWTGFSTLKGTDRERLHTGVPRSHQTSNIKQKQRKKRGIKAFSLFLPSPPASVVRGDISYIFIYRATIFVRPAFLAPPFFVARSAAWEEPPWDAAPRFLPPPFGRGDAFALGGFVAFVAFVVLVAAATAVVVAAAAAADGDGDGASGSNGSASISCGAGAPTFEERDCA